MTVMRLEFGHKELDIKMAESFENVSKFVMDITSG